MNGNKLFSLSLLLLPLGFAGCMLEPSPPLASGNPAVEEPSSALPPGDFITFFDGKGTAAASYEISDGMVVVDGDIVLGKASDLLGGRAAASTALGKASGNILGSAMPGQANSWPSGRIPYMVETDDARKATILTAIREWNGKAAVIWVPKTAQDLDYVAFVNHASTTNSSMGKVGGRQVINFSPTSDMTGAMHEMGHSSGLYHEHQRSDRPYNINMAGSGIAVQYNNANFQEMGASVGAYDHKSIMHYSVGKYYFTWDTGCSCWKTSSVGTDNWLTLENQPGKPSIAPGTTLSAGDLQTLRSVYMLSLPYDAATSQSLTPGLGWPLVRTFKAGGVNYILHYNKADGQFRTYSVNSTGTIISNPVEWGTWSAGWSMIEFYAIGAQTYALFYNRTSGLAAFYTMNANNGKLGSFIEQQNWAAGWDIARIYKPTDASQRYMYLYCKANGLSHIWGMKANGALDLARNTFSAGFTGYDDFQIMEDVWCDWYNGQLNLPFKSTFLLFHDQESSTQYLALLNKTGGMGQVIATAGVGTGFNQVNVYHRSNRSQAMYYNKSNGKLMIFDVRPVFTGNLANPPMTSAGFAAIRNHTTSANYQVHNFNIHPWSADPKGAERLLLFHQGLGRFWSSNLVPFPSI
jgi:hypothetical protein